MIAEESTLVETAVPVMPVASSPSATRPAGFSNAIWAIADQVIVSGTSFLTFVLIGRFTSPADLGLYALGFTLLLVSLTIQNSLVTLPLTIFLARASEEERRSIAGSALVQQLILGCLGSMLFISAGLVIASTVGGSQLAAVLVALAVSSPFCLLREFVRRVEFARLRYSSAFRYDLGVTILQLSLLLSLSVTQHLTAVTAHLSLGAASGAVGVIVVALQRREFQIALSKLRGHWLRNIRFGRWLVATNLVSIIYSYAMAWFLWLDRGASATGTWTACMSLVDLSNPFVIGLGNAVGPHSAHAAREGFSAVRRVCSRATLIVGVVIVAFAIVINLYGDLALKLLYGSEFRVAGATITLLSLAVLCQALGMPAAEGLSAVEMPRANLIASVAGIAVAMSAAFMLVSAADLVGAATAMMLGSSVTMAFRHGLFWYFTRNLQDGESDD